MPLRDDLLDILRPFDGEQRIDRDEPIRIPRTDWNKVVFRRDHGPGGLEANFAARVPPSAGQEQIASLILGFATDAVQYQVKKSMYVSLIHLPTSKNADRWESL